MSVGRWAAGIPIENPGVASEFVLRLINGILYPGVRVLHRATLDGLERLPESGPFLLVTNHSGGLGIAEINAFASLYANRFGRTRPLAGFAHPASFHLWPLTFLFREIGAIPSTYAAAERALDLGVPILLFPGGDHEAMRPIWQANRVDFAGRVGFLRIARKAKVPIVPMGIRGGHMTAPMLLRSPFFAYLFVWPRLVGLKRYALSLLAVLGVALILTTVPLAWPWRCLLAWAWAGSPLALAPWVPWRLRLRIGEPIPAESLFDFALEAGAEGGARTAFDPELARAGVTVEAAVQRLVSHRSPEGD